ncbi:MAG: phosphoribosylglycinamide formyltransferase [Acidobacteriota bacterium]
MLISGRGSNLQAVIDAAGDGRIASTIRVVVANRADAAGLERAQTAGIETVVMPHNDYASRDAYDRALVDALRARGVGLVCLAGFMRLLGGTFCAAFPSAVLNIHPSLLPSFPGAHAQAQAIAHGVKVSGATVHFVTPDLDAGPIILQSAVPVLDDDTADSLAARILVVEHQIYPQAIQHVLEGTVIVHGRKVTLRRRHPRAAKLFADDATPVNETS